MQFTNQVVVITGAAGGIGKGLAAAYAKQGAVLVTADVDEEAGERNARELNESGGEATFVKTDIRKEQDVIRLMDTAVAEYGRIDILINNAGVSRWKPVYELTAEEWDDVLGINLRGTFLCSREAAGRMKQAGRKGSIVNIASTRAFMSEPDSEAYAASKGGIIALTHALAVSLGPDGIRVNCISPGWIETGDYSALRETDHKQHPAGRVGRPEDVFRACCYLTDPDNDFVTGVNLMVDGGMTRKMIYEP